MTSAAPPPDTRFETKIAVVLAMHPCAVGCGRAAEIGHPGRRQEDGVQFSAGQAGCTVAESLQKLRSRPMQTGITVPAHMPPPTLETRIVSQPAHCGLSFFARGRVRAYVGALALVVALAIAIAAPSDASATTDGPGGTGVALASNTIPAGWLEANGQSTAGYPELAAIVGANVPDMRGRFPLGADATYTAGMTGGSLDHTHSLPAHTHTIVTDGAHSHGFASHTHQGRAHYHTGWQNMTVTNSGTTHNHQNAQGRQFVVMGVTNAQSEYLLASGGVGIRRSAATASSGNHQHVYNGNIDATSSADGDTNWVTGGGAGSLTSPVDGAHDHGGVTGSLGAAVGSSNPPYQTFRFIIKASSTAGQPCGAVWGTARATASPGAYLAQGQTTISRTGEPTLNGCLGPTTYPFGTAGSTVFTLPDLRGRIPLALTSVVGTGSTLGAIGGSISHTHVIQHHAHTIAADGSHSATLPAHDHNVAHNHSAHLETTFAGAHTHNPNVSGDFVGEDNTAATRASGGSRNYDTPETTSLDGGHPATFAGRAGRSAGASPPGVDGGTGARSSSDSVTSPLNASHTHGGTVATTSGSTGAANAPYRVINYEINSSTSTGPSVGTVVPWLGTGLPPAGWREAKGDQVSQTAYSELYAVTGNTYDSATVAGMFNLPNLQRRMPIGLGSATVVDTLNKSGGAMGHTHSALHSHTTTVQADHTHGGLDHDHTIWGHYHDFSQSAYDGGHDHGIAGGGNFWGTHISGGANSITDAQGGSGRNTANVAYTDQAWSGHNDSFDASQSWVGKQTLANTGNQDLTTVSGSTSVTSTDPAGAHDHVIGSTDPGTSAADPAFYAIRYIIRVVAETIIDNQVGDTTWRNSNSGSYDVDFYEPDSLTSLQVDTWTGAGQTGTERQAWTQFAAPNATSYTTNWALPASTWTAMAEGTNYVSVKLATTSGYSFSTTDAFFVKKDTVAPSNVTASGTSPTLIAPVVTWGGATDATSGVAFYRVFRGTSSTGPWTMVNTDGATTGTSFTDSAAPYGTSYYLVRAVDNAGNVATGGTASAAVVYHRAPSIPTLSAPAAGATGLGSTPALSAGYSDPDANTGTASFQVCSDAACTSVLRSGTSTSTASGGTASWTTSPALPTGVTYYWRAMATDAYGATSAWSATRSFSTVSVTVTSTSPTSGPQGRRGLVVRVNGTAFAAGANATFSGTGITVLGTSFVSSTQLDVTIDIAGAATISARDVTVTNADASTATGSALFSITAPTISIVMSSLSYSAGARDTVAPYAVDFGIVTPGIARTIGPGGSGQTLPGAAVAIDITADTTTEVLTHTSAWTGPASPALATTYLWKPSASGSWTGYSTVDALAEQLLAPNPPQRTYDLQVAMPGGQLAGAYSTTSVWTVIVQP
jgi:hypothetical protein